MAVYLDGTIRLEAGVLFEFLILEGAQAGLSWETILKKRDGYRRAFADFDPAKVARFTDARVARLMNDAGIVRNRLKLRVHAGRRHSRRSHGRLLSRASSASEGHVKRMTPALEEASPQSGRMTDGLCYWFGKRKTP